jgi:autotransporter-associated beta strand protein
MLVLIPTAAYADAEDSRARLVEAILQRVPEWKGTQVEIPLDLYVRYFQAQMAGPKIPTPPEGVWLERAAWSLALDGETPVWSVTFDVRRLPGASSKGLRLLPTSLAWQDITVGGKPAELRRNDDGWFYFDAPEAGSFVIAAKAPVKPSKSGDVSTCSFAVPQAVLVSVAAESAKAWEVRVKGSPLPILGSEKGTHGLVGLAPVTQLETSWQPPRPEVHREARIESESVIGWTLADAVHQIRAAVELRLWGGEVEQLTVNLPPGAERVSITGPDVRDVKVLSGSAKIMLRGPVAQRTRLAISFEVARPATGRMTMPAFGVDGASPRGGSLAIAGGSGAVILEMDSKGLAPLPLHDLPETVKGLLAAAPVYAYQMSGAFDANIDVVDLAEFPVRETLVDSALYTVLFRPDGSIMAKVVYEVRNRNQQYMKVDLPPGAQLVVAHVAEQQRNLARGPDRTMYVPLEKSVLTTAGLVSFPVELVYLMPGQALTKEGEFRLPLPQTDLPVAYARCALMVPDGMNVRQWTGPLREVPKWSTETAQREFEYGTGHAAAKPKVEVIKREGPDVLKAMGLVAAQNELGKFSGYDAKYNAVQMDDREREKMAQQEALDDLQAQQRTIQGKNYYRAGVDFYNRGDYNKAKALLGQVVQIAPDTVEADNALKYLGNVDIALGKGGKGGGDRTTQATTKAIQMAQNVGNVDLLGEQQDMLRQAEQAEKAGDVSKAAAAYKVATGLSGKLQARGESTQEQDAIVRRAQEFLKQNEAKQVQDLFKGNANFALGKSVTLTKEEVSQPAANASVFEYHLKNADATSLAETLGRTLNTSAGGGRGGGGGGRGGLAVTADKQSNSILVSGSEEDIRKVAAMLQSLDSSTASQKLTKIGTDSVDASGNTLTLGAAGISGGSSFSAKEPARAPQIEMGQAIAEQQVKLGEKMLQPLRGYAQTPGDGKDGTGFSVGSYSLGGFSQPQSQLAQATDRDWAVSDPSMPSSSAQDVNLLAVRAQELAAAGNVAEAKQLYDEISARFGPSQESVRKAADEQKVRESAVAQARSRRPQFGSTEPQIQGESGANLANLGPATNSNLGGGVLLSGDRGYRVVSPGADRLPGGQVQAFARDVSPVVNQSAVGFAPQLESAPTGATHEGDGRHADDTVTLGTVVFEGASVPLRAPPGANFVMDNSGPNSDIPVTGRVSGPGGREVPVTTVDSGATWDLNGYNQTINSVSGSGGVILGGGSQTYQGGTVVSGGAIDIQSNSNNVAVTISNGSVLGTGNVTLNGGGLGVTSATLTGGGPLEVRAETSRDVDLRERQNKTAALWQRATELRKAMQLEDAIQVVDRIQALDPSDDRAQRWREDLLFLASQNRQANIHSVRDRGAVESMTDTEESSIHPGRLAGGEEANLRYPSAQQWKELTEVRRELQKAVVAPARPTAEDEQVAEARRNLEKARQAIQQQNAKLDRVQLSVNDIATNAEDEKKLAEFVATNYSWALAQQAPPPPAPPALQPPSAGPQGGPAPYFIVQNGTLTSVSDAQAGSGQAIGQNWATNAATNARVQPTFMPRSGTMANGGDLRSGTFSGTLGGGGGLTKTGAGTVVLSGANAYTGGTVVNNGTLRLSNTSGTAFGGGTVRLGASNDFAGHDINSTADYATLSERTTNGAIRTGAGANVMTGTASMGNATTFNGAISGGALSLQKVGSGQLVLDNRTRQPVVVTQPMQVNAGTVILNGSTNTLTISGAISNSRSITVNSSGVIDIGNAIRPGSMNSVEAGAPAGFYENAGAVPVYGSFNMNNVGFDSDRITGTGNINYVGGGAGVAGLAANSNATINMGADNAIPAGEDGALMTLADRNGFVGTYSVNGRRVQAGGPARTSVQIVDGGLVNLNTAPAYAFAEGYDDSAKIFIDGVDNDGDGDVNQFGSRVMVPAARQHLEGVSINSGANLSWNTDARDLTWVKGSLSHTPPAYKGNGQAIGGFEGLGHGTQWADSTNHYVGVDAGTTQVLGAALTPLGFGNGTTSDLVGFRDATTANQAGGLQANGNWAQGANRSYMGDAVQATGGNLAVVNNAQAVTQVQSLLERLRSNMGQRVAVGSRNILVKPASAKAAGIVWKQGPGGVKYAVANEGQLLGLLDLEQRQSAPEAQVAARGEVRQEAIVGTDARLANGGTVTISRAGDTQNGLTYNGVEVPVEHDDYLLVDSGTYLTVVKTGRMQHWSAEVEPVEFPGVPAIVMVPVVGRTVKFEKTLLDASDTLELVGHYTWQGETK